MDINLQGWSRNNINTLVEYLIKMFRDLKEYKNLQKLYEEKVSNVKVELEKKLNNNNKKIDTSFDSSKIVKDIIDKKNQNTNSNVNVKSGPDLNAISKYTDNNRREVTMKDFTPEIKKDKVEVKDKVMRRHGIGLQDVIDFFNDVLDYRRKFAIKSEMVFGPNDT